MDETTSIGYDAGDQLKDSSVDNWCNSTCENTHNFSALPGGRNQFGSFLWEGSYGWWWSSSSKTTGDNWGWMYRLDHNSSKVYRYEEWGANGKSVRCIKSNND